MLERIARLLPVLLISLASSSGGAEPVLTPQQGILLLRNGQILQGEITRAGDYYVVTLGPTGEIKLPAADVEFQSRNLAEAYVHKQATLLGSGAAPHLDLAEWCLRHGLYSRSGEQLLIAMRLEPENPRVTLLDRRLQEAMQPPKPIAPRTASAGGTVSNDELEKALRDLPKGTLEKFSAVVQPLLLNRCGANQCHGPTSKSELHLLRPAAGQNANQRFTQRNLFVVLQQIDRERPERSPLLTMPQRRHGNSVSAIFDERTKKQLDELTAWVRIVCGQVEPSRGVAAIQPATVGTTPAASALHQPSTVPEASPIARQEPSLPPAGEDEANPKGFLPRDEFDPEIFNRRYIKSR